MLIIPYCLVANNVKIFYTLEGDSKNPLLLLSHGYGSDHHSFDQIVPFFLPYFQILRWDHRGHGDSDKPKSNNYEDTLKNYTVKQMATDIYSLINKVDKLGPRKKYLYGHSMGGMIAQQFAIEHQNLLSGLALGSTTATLKDGPLLEMLELYKKGILKFDENSFRQSVEAGYSPSFLKQHPEIIQESIQRKMRVGPMILLALLENFVLNYDVSNALTRINIPTIILSGDQDRTIDLSNSKKIHELIPNSILKIFPGIGHGINSEIPKDIADLIAHFFLSN